MICIEATIPSWLCEIDDELKAIYHSKETFYVWIFKTRLLRNQFMKETVDMIKSERENHFLQKYHSL